MLRAASYARYSSDNQRGESAEAQLADNRRYADRNNMRIVREYVDEAETGRSDNRDDFQKMIRDAKNNKFDVIIVHKVDRFARNRYDSAIYKHTLKRHGVKVHYSVQNIDDSPEGNLMEGMLESFAEYYSLNLAKEVMKGMNINAQKAKFNGGVPPLGYDINEDKEYVINESEAHIVREIFNLYINGSGYKEIANILNSRKLKNKQGRSFKFNSIPGILKNKKYIGIYEYNKTSRGFGDNGKRNLIKLNPKEERIIVEDAIPSIVTKEVFRMAQDELKKRSTGRGKSKSVRDYFLSGLVICNDCRRKMSGYSQSRVKGGDRYFYYRCTGCSSSIRAEVIEDKVKGELNRIIFSNPEKLLKDIHKYILEVQEEAPDELKYLKNEYDKADKESDRIVDMIAKGTGSTKLGKRLEEFEEYMEMVQDRMADINTKISIPEDELKEWLLKLKVNFDDGINLKRITSTFIKEIRITDEEYEIDFFIRAPQVGASRITDALPALLLFAQTNKYKREDRK